MEGNNQTMSINVKELTLYDKETIRSVSDIFQLIKG